MFKNAKRKRIEKEILSISASRTVEFKRELIDLLRNESSLTEEEAQSRYAEIRRKYLNGVAEGISFFMFNNDKEKDKLYKELLNEELKNHPEGIMAGNLFEIIWLAETNTYSPFNNGVLLNHKQNDIITSLMHEVDDAL